MEKASLSRGKGSTHPSSTREDAGQNPPVRHGVTATHPATVLVGGGETEYHAHTRSPSRQADEQVRPNSRN